MKRVIVRRKSFNTNEEYFKFINNSKYEVKSVSITKKKILITYIVK